MILVVLLFRSLIVLLLPTAMIRPRSIAKACATEKILVNRENFSVNQNGVDVIAGESYCAKG